LVPCGSIVAEQRSERRRFAISGRIAQPSNVLIWMRARGRHRLARKPYPRARRGSRMKAFTRHTQRCGCQASRGRTLQCFRPGRPEGGDRGRARSSRSSPRRCFRRRTRLHRSPTDRSSGAQLQRGGGDSDLPERRSHPFGRGRRAMPPLPGSTWSYSTPLNCRSKRTCVRPGEPLQP